MRVICPICKHELIHLDRRYACKNGHSFDQAKQGYTNLLVGHSQKEHGDAKDMLAARLHIQEKNYYQEVAEHLVDLIKDLPVQQAIDIGCGVGYYANYMRELLSLDMIGIDISKEALKIASRKGPLVDHFVASAKDLPIAKDAVDLIVSVFSPVYLEEFRRILKQGKFLLVVSPNPGHLMELKKVIYDEIIAKEEERNYIVEDDFTLIKQVNIRENKRFFEEDLKHLFLMTPHYWTSSISGKERLAGLKELRITLDMNVRLYQFGGKHG